MGRLKSLTIAIGAGIIPAAALAEDRPVALIEHIQAGPGAALQAFDYVYKNDKIDLRPDGELTLAYFDNCQTETFTGGVVKLKNASAKITKNGVSTKSERPCQTAALALSADAREAGASVKRVTPFPEDEWREISIVTATPRFIWPQSSDGSTEATISIYFLDSDPATLVWQGTSNANNVVYPDDAPALQIGMPYEAVVSYGGDPQTAVVFSVDPNLELPDSPLTNAVPLGL